MTLSTGLRSIVIYSVLPIRKECSPKVWCPIRHRISSRSFKGRSLNSETDGRWFDQLEVLHTWRSRYCRERIVLRVLPAVFGMCKKIMFLGLPTSQIGAAWNEHSTIILYGADRTTPLPPRRSSSRSHRNCKAFSLRVHEAFYFIYYANKKVRPKVYSNVSENLDILKLII